MAGLSGGIHHVAVGHLPVHTFLKVEVFAESDVTSLYEPTVRKTVRESLDKNMKMLLHEAHCLKLTFF